MEKTLINHVCSLGSNCMPSFFLQAQGLKIKSYPFDWCFSEEESIRYCIKNKFKDFLNADLHKPKDTNYIYNIKTKNKYPLIQLGGGDRSHERHPLNDMPYYERCVERFNKMIESGEPTLFVTSFKNRNLLEVELRKLNENIHFIEIHGRRKEVESLHLINKKYDLRKKYDFKLS